ncbi:MAG: DUF1801 domain-containing protein [Euryarchaeota archaeon]|nr:DUF1801 domain-containing protein [Euryarchaeota archaeon]MDE1837988.1 DUF1801 domain-containing protein [Euryarchaeota archaeon]MDE1881402.1 DUF1801 domain-containing protein [Euryarchaeota archaeon]MDE2046426.1 DUF1801 domain-containing protein [Thermoplasmata archaeon]
MSEFVGRAMPAAKKPSDRSGKRSSGFSDEERSAMREAVREQKIVWGKDREKDERAVLAKIAEFPEPDRSIAKRLHAVITSTAPELSPRLWYGMPAYSKGGDVLCFFQPASKFKARYGTLGFGNEAKLDEGQMWPTSFALMQMTAAEEARIAALLKKAVS